MLQGLNKPVNDLSRGALVEDIVNTVAITAIQAQGADDASLAVLVLNAGSSSLKYQLIEPDSGRSLADGKSSRSGSRRRPLPTTLRRLRVGFREVVRPRHRPEDLRAGRGRTPGRPRRGRFLPAHRRRRRGDRRARQVVDTGPVAQSARDRGYPGGPQATARCPACGGVRHRVLP